jgi:tuberculosinol/isotuberculosinol synthase
MISLEHFLELPSKEVAQLVKESGSKVIVFPFNGTRRWFLLEHGRENHANPVEAYIDLTSKRYIEMYQMLFDHGLDTVIAPVFGGEILNRGPEYMEQIGYSMSLLAEHPYFLSFYEKYNVRVHFYGDHQKELAGTAYAHISDLFAQVTKQTLQNNGPRLFYGIFGTDATAAVAKMSVEQYQLTRQIPTRNELVTMYYGEYIEKADIFIGFEKFSAFDYPLLNLGGESLYFTVAPSLYMSETQLRNILYDYLYLRPLEEPDYFKMPVEDFETMRRFYKIHREKTLGIGRVNGGIWYPKSSPQE